MVEKLESKFEGAEYLQWDAASSTNGSNVTKRVGIESSEWFESASESFSDTLLILIQELAAAMSWCCVVFVLSRLDRQTKLI